MTKGEDETKINKQKTTKKQQKAEEEAQVL